MTDPTELNGTNLTAGLIQELAKQGTQIVLSEDGLNRMAKARRLVDRVIAENIPVYGITTGLGARASEALSPAELADFSVQTVRGRAHAVGPYLPAEIVRAGMLVRLNTLLLGHAGAQPKIAEYIASCLNAGITPCVGESASIGAGDLVWNATWALSLIGSGKMFRPDGTHGASSEVLGQFGFEPLELGPRDGLALCSNSSLSAGLSAVALACAEQAMYVADRAAALTMEGFRANLSPFDPRVLQVGKKPGQLEAAERIMSLLTGSQLHDPMQARRLQDPLSIRNIPQIHGTVLAALRFAEAALDPEINGSSDNPVALIETGEILSNGAYLTTALTNALESVSRAITALSMAQVARISKMLSPQFTDLPLFLAEKSNTSNGFAPVMKTAEALVSEIAHAGQATSVWPSINANGVEDVMSPTPVAAKALNTIVEKSKLLSAIELLVATTAIEQRRIVADLPASLSVLYSQIREKAPSNPKDRPLTDDIAAITELFAAEVV